jgi:hypothetical protein
MHLLNHFSTASECKSMEIFLKSRVVNCRLGSGQPLESNQPQSKKMVYPWLIGPPLPCQVRKPARYASRGVVGPTARMSVGFALTSASFFSGVRGQGGSPPVVDPGFQHRVFLKINFIQRYKKYIISTHIYQYILDFSIEKQATRVFPGIPGYQC